ncbi:MAG TPA: hypothetical protein VLH61_11205 [Bacteroidales bacterium]|nr:hypothetical protein [Bacteroidales bacterium]
MPRKTPLKLDYKSPFTAMLVFSSQKGYRLAWLLNNQLEFELKRLGNFLNTVAEHQPSNHELYGFYQANLRMHILLLENKSNTGALIIQEKPVPDFILFFYNLPKGYDLKGFLSKARKIKELLAIAPMDERYAGKYYGYFYDLEVFLSSHPVE